MQEINQAMQDSLGVVRNGNSLLKGIRKVQELKGNSSAPVHGRTGVFLGGLRIRLTAFFVEIPHS